MNMKPFGLAPFPHNMVASFDFSWAVLKDHYHSAPLHEEEGKVPSPNIDPMTHPDWHEDMSEEESFALAEKLNPVDEDEEPDEWMGDESPEHFERMKEQGYPKYKDDDEEDDEDPMAQHEMEEEFRHHQAEGIEPPNRAHRPTPPPEEEPSNPFAKAWAFLKALPEQQMRYPARIGEQGDRHGTVHPAIAGLLERHGYGDSEGFEVPSVESMDMYGTNHGYGIRNLPGSANWRYPAREPKENQSDFKDRQKDVRGAYLDPDEEDRQRAQRAHDGNVLTSLVEGTDPMPTVEDYMPGGSHHDVTRPRTPELGSMPNVPYTDPRHEMHHTRRPEDPDRFYDWRGDEVLS